MAFAPAARVGTTPPVVTVPASIARGPTQYDGTPVDFTTSAYDLVDGAITEIACTWSSGSLFPVGTTTTVTCSATDGHGNEGSASFTVTIAGYTFVGFFQPIDNGAAVNAVKGGSTVPVKWKLLGEGGVELTSLGAVDLARTGTYVVPCTSAGTEVPVELTTTGGTTLRYDLTAAQYIFNWQTPRQPGACVRLEVAFTDHTTKTASFRLK